MVLSLNRIFSVNENFTPVIVLRPEPVEILRMEAEHEIISENRIIVLEHSCNLPLVHSPEIKFHGFVLGELRLREELIELGNNYHFPVDEGEGLHQLISFVLSNTIDVIVFWFVPIKK